VAAKIKDFERPNSTEFKNAPKRDIVDTNPHAYCAPGTTRTNNTAFLLYGSGHNKQKGRSSNEANGRDFEGFGTSRYAFIRVGCTNEADGRIFETFCYAFARSMVNPRVKADGRVFYGAGHGVRWIHANERVLG
jgi:hypothetical protein